MDFCTIAVNPSILILVNQGTGNYSAIELDLPKSPMFTLNAMSRNTELACHWKRKLSRLFSSSTINLMIMVNLKSSVSNSLNSHNNLRYLMKKYESVHFSFEAERWLEFRHYIAKKMAMT